MAVAVGDLVPGLVGDDPHQIQPAAEVGGGALATGRGHGGQQRVPVPVASLRRAPLILDFDPDPVVAGHDREQERPALVPAG
jgi:hypothetical protein